MKSLCTADSQCCQCEVVMYGGQCCQLKSLCTADSQCCQCTCCQCEVGTADSVVSVCRYVRQTVSVVSVCRYVRRTVSVVSMKSLCTADSQCCQCEVVMYGGQCCQCEVVMYGGQSVLSV